MGILRLHISWQFQLAFFGEIGNRIQIYNYEKSGIPPEEVFAYYDDIYISPEYFVDFTEAKRIGINITDNDDLSELAYFTDLKELKIYIENEVSQDTINKIVEILPDCEVTYRSKKYGKIRKKESIPNSVWTRNSAIKEYMKRPIVRAVNLICIMMYAISARLYGEDKYLDLSEERSGFIGWFFDYNPLDHSSSTISKA